jgi:hypothetical protein
MGSVAAIPPRALALDEGRDRRPLAWIASPPRGGARRGRAWRLAAVLEEFGYRTTIAEPPPEEPDLPDALAPDRLADLLAASLVGCDIVRPEVDLPVELAVAATRGIAVLALVPDEVPVDGLAAQLLEDSRATVVRYRRVDPHRALHERLLRDGPPV